MTVTRIDSRAFDLKKKKLLEDIGYLVEGEAIIHCPVETGNMRSKITHEVIDENSVKIGTVGVPYAFFVENGTDVMIKAHGEHDPKNPVTKWDALEKRGGSGQTMPFIRSAAFTSEPKIKQMISRAFKK